MSQTALTLPLDRERTARLRAGEEILLSGDVLTGRDKACARLYELLESGEPLPVDVRDQLIYFVGPTPPPPGMTIGSAGPTTSGRMNRFLPRLFGAGLRGCIGKGYLGDEVKRSLVDLGCVYFGAIGGTGALLADSIAAVEVVAFEEFGTEAMRRITLRDFPVVVLNDTHGGDLYAAARQAARD